MMDTGQKCEYSKVPNDQEALKREVFVTWVVSLLGSTFLDFLGESSAECEYAGNFQKKAITI